MIFLIYSFALTAQQSSKNGWYLPTYDTVRVFLVFVEIDYDTLSHLDGTVSSDVNWPPRALPHWAPTVFDPYPLAEAQGTMTQYYEECSLGNFTVLGDYFPEVITVPYSEIVDGRRSLTGHISKALDAREPLVSQNGLGIADFDLWEDARKAGTPKEKRVGEVSGLDHVMIIIRNYHKQPRATGRASQSGAIKVKGMQCDTYSMFGGTESLPFGILRHEFNHLLIGSNNFHSGGGNSAGFQSYFPFLQGGWSMMGAAHSSLTTCSGWDRLWLGWQAKGNEHIISVRDEDGGEQDGDLSDSDAGIYILRDFVTTGDVIRIKLPFIPEEEYQQWLWIENHLTESKNGSPFDRFQYHMYDCLTGAESGLYMHMQVDADTREGPNIYGKVKADYLRSVLADGNYDLHWEAEPLELGYCVNNEPYVPYFCDPDFENALTGNHSIEFAQYYDQNTTELNASTSRILGTRREGNVYERISYLGHPRNGFRESGNSRIGIGTNPSAASMLTLVSSRKPARDNSKNNRKVYLNGISVEILETLSDHSLKVKITFADHEMMQDRRWCAPEMILNNHNPKGADLNVKALLRLNRGETMTRFDHPDSSLGRHYFTDRTMLVVADGAEIKVSGQIRIEKDSEMLFKSGSRLKLDASGRIEVGEKAKIRVEEGVKIKGRGLIHIPKGAVLSCGSAKTFRRFGKRAYGNGKVMLASPREP